MLCAGCNTRTYDARAGCPHYGYRCNKPGGNSRWEQQPFSGTAFWAPLSTSFGRVNYCQISHGREREIYAQFTNLPFGISGERPNLEIRRSRVRKHFPLAAPGKSAGVEPRLPEASSLKASKALNSVGISGGSFRPARFRVVYTTRRRAYLGRLGAGCFARLNLAHFPPAPAPRSN